VIIPCSQNRNGPLTGAPGPVEIFFQISELRSNMQILKRSQSLLQKYSNFAWG
jgi:hypothetical protein